MARAFDVESSGGTSKSFFDAIQQILTLANWNLHGRWNWQNISARKRTFPDKQRGPSRIYSGRNGNPTMTRSDDVDDVCLGGISLVAWRKTELLNLILSVRSTWTRSSSFLFDNRVTGKTEIKLGSFVTQRRHRNAFVPRSVGMGYVL